MSHFFNVKLNLNFIFLFGITLSSQKLEMFFNEFCIDSYLNTLLDCVGINDGKHSVSKHKQLYLNTTE